MAKSMRSKWKRKCRAVKRERYAVKELARLKKMLGVKEEDKVTETEVMESDQVIMFDANTLKEQSKKKKKGKNQPIEENKEDVEMSSDEEKIEVEDSDGKKKIYNSKTLKDENGQYPVWLHKRKIAKMNKVGKKTNKKKLRKRRR